MTRRWLGGLAIGVLGAAFLFDSGLNALQVAGVASIAWSAAVCHGVGR